MITPQPPRQVFSVCKEHRGIRSVIAVWKQCLTGPENQTCLPLAVSAFSQSGNTYMELPTLGTFCQRVGNSINSSLPFSTMCNVDLALFDTATILPPSPACRSYIQSISLQWSLLLQQSHEGFTSPSWDLVCASGFYYLLFVLHASVLCVGHWFNILCTGQGVCSLFNRETCLERITVGYFSCRHRALLWDSNPQVGHSSI